MQTQIIVNETIEGACLIMHQNCRLPQKDAIIFGMSKKKKKSSGRF